MQALSHKTKQYLVLVAKLLIVGAAFYYIGHRLSNDKALEWQYFSTALSHNNGIIPLAIALILTVLNRFFEILKWQALAGTLKPIRLWQSTKQVLAAVTLAIFTPNGLGEYAAKALYYKKEQAKQVIFLNLVCNGIQMIVAVLAGIAGIIIFNRAYHLVPGVLLALILLGITAVLGLFFMSRKIALKGYSLQRLFENIQLIPKQIHRKNILYAVLRYLCIIHQHYLIFVAFGVQQPYFMMIAAIAAVYFLGSSLPNFTFTDFAVRGSVAVLFFSKMDVNEWVVVLAATLQWLLNIVLPVTIGAWFVLRFKPNQPAAHQE
jgi:hypothetical protein